MPDDYLWDGSGEPDAETQRLESLLAPFRFDRQAPKWPDAPLPERPRKKDRRLRRWVLPVLAFAAVVALVIWLRQAETGWQRGWEVTSLSGAPRVGDRAVRGEARFGVGEWLDTDSESRARLRVDGLGEIEVEPNSRLQLLEARKDAQHMSLARGVIRASITADPYVFLVRTPSAYALDMGCSYTMEVADNGSGILRVTLGWVQFQHDGIQSMVPAGAAAETQPGFGPGAPYFEDASPEFRHALHIVNFDLSDPASRSAGLTTVLAEARPRDALTLLNLFRRVPQEERGRLFDRLAQLLPPPPGVDRQAAIDGDYNTLNPWWPELHLGSAKKGMKSPPRIDE
jgi:ferric-dicitrate binding protein FerR (iron transport regulator)